MRALSIVLDYPGAEQMWRIWAESERTIDFRRDVFAAGRCTASFAASELKYFLEKADPELSVNVVSARVPDGAFIELKIADRDTGGGFELLPEANGTVVRGDDRNGLLNGAYELLRMQGWRWLEPGPYGESAPRNPGLDFLKEKKICIPSFRYRMIDQYRESDDSVELLRWMARNRINVVFRKAATGKFADKLGMFSRKGGHLLQKLMNPETPMKDGRTIFESHPEWYGLPEDGIRKKETAVRTQLCISQPGLLEYLSEKLLHLLEHEMSEIDIVDIWGFDTWGRNCHCEACRDKGNGADQNLYLLSHIRKSLNARLKRKVIMNTISYEGTVTMEPPEKPVPQPLIDAGDFVIFYPIRRCYRHPLADKTCPLNTPYRESLEGWHRKAPELALWGGEYYNVSKFEDLPLVFSGMIPTETRYYHKNGCCGMTYMHNLSPNWGVRALTQLQHTAYAWDVNTDDAAFPEEYFQRKYGVHAAELRRIYADIEEATADISSWRNWGVGALDILMPWEGGRPEKEFALPHFPSSGETVKALRKSADLLDGAVRNLRLCLRREQERNWRDLPAIQEIPPIVTPLELERIRYYDTLEYRIGEDLRGVIYGADTMRLLQLVVEYHNALFRGEDGETLWNQIESVTAKMSDYYVPVTYENPTPGVQIKDALTRTQLRMLITRCRGARIQSKESRK